MKQLLTSGIRIAGALALVALMAALGIGGWLAWQDHRYTTALSQAHERVVARNGADFQARMSTVPTYLCEKRRGMPVTEVLTHLAHATDDVEVVAARRTAESVKRIDAPSRWSDFQNLATTRREVLVEMAIAYDSANARAIEVASAAQPKTELAVVEALGTDREYRDLEAAAKQLRLDVRDLESKMRKAVPDHHIPSDVIKQELLQTNVEGMLQLGAMYETASRPKEILIDESDSSATQNGGPATAASGNPAYPALIPVQGSGAPLC